MHADAPMPAPPVPSGRRTVATVSTYPLAEHTVDWLADQDFPVERVAIVGTGLRYVEQVQGRLTTGRAALVGMAQGVLVGLFVGLLFTLFFELSAGGFLGVVLYGVVAGAVVGALSGAAFHRARRGRRDFASVAETRADRYEVQVDEADADQAERLLRLMRVPL